MRQRRYQLHCGGLGAIEIISFDGFENPNSLLAGSFEWFCFLLSFVQIICVVLQVLISYIYLLPPLLTQHLPLLQIHSTAMSSQVTRVDDYSTNDVGDQPASDGEDAAFAETFTPSLETHVNDINDVYITVSAGDNFGLRFIEIEDKGQRVIAIADIDQQNCRFTNKVAVGDLVVTLNGVAVRSSDELNTPDRNVERRLVIRKLHKTGLPPSLPCFKINSKIDTPVLVVKIPVGLMKTKFMNEGGPIVVHQGSQGSRMMGILKKNDTILTVDNILVHGLPTKKVVKLLRRREHSTRTLIILRNIPSPYNNQKPY
jgi:hypothetical protein